MAAVAVTLIQVIVVVLSDGHLEKIGGIFVYLTAAGASCEDTLSAGRSGQALVMIAPQIRREHSPRVLVGSELRRVSLPNLLISKARAKEIVALGSGGFEHLLRSDIDRDAQVLDEVHELLRYID